MLLVLVHAWATTVQVVVQLLHTVLLVAEHATLWYFPAVQLMHLVHTVLLVALQGVA